MTLVLTVVITNVASSQAPQYPVLQQIAEKVIAKYQTSSCAQLWQEKQTPPSAQKAEKTQKVVEQLRNNPDMRTQF
jgi:hypothetical protein